MEQELGKLLLNQLSARAMAIAFIFYLLKKDKETSQTYQDFNKTIQNHLKHALKTEVSLSKSLEKLCTVIQNLKDKGVK